MARIIDIFHSMTAQELYSDPMFWVSASECHRPLRSFLTTQIVVPSNLDNYIFINEIEICQSTMPRSRVASFVYVGSKYSGYFKLLLSSVGYIRPNKKNYWYFLI